MKTKTYLLLIIRPSAAAAFGTALVAAFTLFTTAARAPAQTAWGNALSFDWGSSYLRTTIPPLASNYTVSTWLYLRAGGIYWGPVGVLSAATCGDSAELLVRSQTSSSLDPQQLELARCDDFNGAISTGTVPLHQWVHVAVTVSATKQVNYFINGLDAGSGDATGRNVTIGPNLTLADNTVRRFDGMLDEFSIWNVARTPDEVRQDIMAPLSGTESNLVAYWKFDEGAGTIAHDATTNHLDGTLVNGPVWTNSTIPLIFLNLNAGLPGVGFSSVAWGDCNNDGWLDILMTGLSDLGRRVEVWRNTGSGFRTLLASPGVEHSSVAWGDYDNDGWLDFLLTGYELSLGEVAQLWRNEMGIDIFGTFTHTNAGLPGVAYSSVAWGDYDNDGRLDILLTGYSRSDGIAQVWRNTGSGFTNVTAAVAPGLPRLVNSSVAWGDYDNDGRLDFLLAGYSASGQIAQVWRNTGSGFVNINTELPGVYLGSVAWGDYDNDGWLDILLTGNTGPGRIAEVWQNTVTGFMNVTATVAPGLPGVEASSVAWGDYDNDGWLDFLLTGTTNGAISGGIAQVWRNTGTGFTNINAGLPGVSSSSVAWADYDNDGRLDFLLTGNTGSSRIAQVWRNIGSTANTLPAPPAGLAATVAGSSVIFSWNPASDAETPAAGLSYNLRVGTTPGGSDIVSPHASAGGGRRLPALGNAQQRLSFPLAFPGTGRFYWSVQAVDTAFAGSSFAPESSFTLWPALGTESGVVPGDANGDGIVSQAELDLVLSHYFPYSPWLYLTNTAGLGGTNVTFALPNSPAGAFSVLMSTNLADWDYLGPATPRYEFTDTNAPAQPQRFYRLRWP